MTWAKKKPMTWEWFQEDCAPEQLAERCGILATKRRLIKYVVPIHGERVVIVSCKGTLVKKAKKKQADEEAG